MKVETKFNQGQQVWFIHESKAVHLKIHSIKIEIEEKDKVDIKYFFDVNQNLNEPFSSKFEIIKESRLFKTRQELIENL